MIRLLKNVWVVSEAQVHRMLLYLVTQNIGREDEVLIHGWFTSRVQAVQFVSTLIGEGDSFYINRWSIPITKENMCSVLNGHVEYQETHKVLTLTKHGKRIFRTIHSLE